MTAINDEQLLVIERNGATATRGGTPFIKIFIADIGGVSSVGFACKIENNSAIEQRGRLFVYPCSCVTSTIRCRFGGTAGS